MTQTIPRQSSATITINHLKPHPAQMRTQYSLDGLAALCLQIYQQGLAKWNPILASPTGQNGTHHIVSGHRRQMGQLLAWDLVQWAEKHPEADITLEVAETMLAAFIEKLGSLEQVIANLLAKYGDREIQFVPFSGTAKEEVLTLQAANYGQEEADMLGIAHSFREAIKEGATPAEIARNAGKKLTYVTNHLALADISPDLAGLIAAGDFPLSVAVAVASVPASKRTGFTVFILANEAKTLTVKEIQGCAKILKKWDGFPLRLTYAQQTHRSIAHALNQLWSKVVTEYPDDAYAAASMLIYRNLHEAPWATGEKAQWWFQALGGDTYFQDGQIHWQNVVTHLMTHFSCQTCPIAQLPRQQLRTDLSDGQGGVLSLLCRNPTVQLDENTRCIHGLAPNDPFDVRVPWAWSEHEGVVHEGGQYRVKSLEALQQAWHAQLAQEEAEDAEQEREKRRQADTVTGGQEDVAAIKNDVADESTTSPDSTPTTPEPPANSPSPTVAKSPTPIEIQRGKIQDFIDDHIRLNVKHPFATQCGKCRHALTQSPTKDDTVPHCQWAGRLRKVYFHTLQPTNGKATAIPVCQQFAPTATWHDLIPAHPNPPDLPRDWVKTQLMLLVKAGQSQHSTIGLPFSFLTGRPMRSSDSYDGWFGDQLKEQIGQLSDAQLWTLFIWATSEWQRGKGGEWLIPTDEKGMQFQTVRRTSW